MHQLQVEAEKVPEVSGHLSVTVVPTFVFLRRGDVVDRLEGYDPGALFDKAAALEGKASSGNAKTASNGVAAAAAGESGKENLHARLRQLTQQQPVMLFMKGSPDMPRCGFSRKVVDALRQEDIPFGHFDILTDEQVRLQEKLSFAVHAGTHRFVCHSLFW